MNVDLPSRMARVKLFRGTTPAELEQAYEAWRQTQVGRESTTKGVEQRSDGPWLLLTVVYVES